MYNSIYFPWSYSWSGIISLFPLDYFFPHLLRYSSKVLAMNLSLLTMTYMIIIIVG